MNQCAETIGDSSAQSSETPCFTPGTRIVTAAGEMPVEDIRVGDKVVTRDNGLQPVRWVGGRSLRGADLASNPHLSPILIKAGALGRGMPERDMRLSPNHRMLVSSDLTALYFEEREVLVAAKHLVNHRGIFGVKSLSVTYVHLLLDQHEIVMADGAWSESFQPDDRSLRAIGNAQRQEILEIFPDLSPPSLVGARKGARRVLSKSEVVRLFEEG